MLVSSLSWQSTLLSILTKSRCSHTHSKWETAPPLSWTSPTHLWHHLYVQCWPYEVIHDRESWRSRCWGGDDPTPSMADHTPSASWSTIEVSGWSKVDLHLTVNVFRGHVQTYLHTYTTGQDRAHQLTQQTYTALNILTRGLHTEQLRLSLTLDRTVFFFFFPLSR